jgi:cytochrome c biogenesis protein CcmG/thiol:disulfide interchange protein DsbE
MTAQTPDLTREQAQPADPAASAVQPAAAPRRRAAWWQIAVFALVVALLGLVAFQMRRNGPLAAGQVGEGEFAPDFELQTFDGETIQLGDLRGQVVVINFWASWCLPCEEEAADLENTWRHYQDQGVVFLGVDYVDTETEARAYLQRWDITYPNGPDLGTAISHRYRIRGVPETFIVDQDGVLRALFVGPTTQAALQAEIEPLLAATD